MIVVCLFSLFSLSLSFSPFLNALCLAPLTKNMIESAKTVSAWKNLVERWMKNFFFILHSMDSKIFFFSNWLEFDEFSYEIGRIPNCQWTQFHDSMLIKHQRIFFEKSMKIMEKLLFFLDRKLHIVFFFQSGMNELIFLREFLTSERNCVKLAKRKRGSKRKYDEMFVRQGLMESKNFSVCERRKKIANWINLLEF